MAHHGFLEDPRLRQRWNQISHNAEAVTETAAVGIWSFQHNYINPCLAAVSTAVDACIAPCLGDREERARRARERARARGRAEFNFDFYDDWYAEDEALFGGGGGGGSGGGGASGSGTGTRSLLGSWSYDDWDRLLAGSGSARRINEVVVGTSDGTPMPTTPQQQQPRRKRQMGYGTRGATPSTRRKVPADLEDPTVIPRTAPIGFLGKLPFKLGGTLRYKPSAADLQDHPGGGASRHDAANPDESEPLLAGSSGDEFDNDDDHHVHLRAYDERTRRQPPYGGRKRSGTTGSGDTSDSYRSRGDLFPSDGEGDEDAVPLDDEFADALGEHKWTASSAGNDDRSSGSHSHRRPRGARRKRSSGTTVGNMSRTVSHTTVSSVGSHPSLRGRDSSLSIPQLASVAAASSPPAERAITEADTETAVAMPLSIEDILRQEDVARREEEEELQRRRRQAALLAVERSLATRGAVSDLQRPLPQTRSQASLHQQPQQQDDGAGPASEGQKDNNDMPEMVEDASTPPLLSSGSASRSVSRTASAQSLDHIAAAAEAATELEDDEDEDDEVFIPARLPRFR